MDKSLSSFANILDAVAANTNIDYNEPAAIDEHRVLNMVDSYETLTESLGFESFNLTSECEFDEEWLWRWRSKEKRKCSTSAVRDFPPVISSLNENGRPRFDVEKKRVNGRLQISYVKNTRPEVVVERRGTADHEESGGGRVRAKFIDGDSSSSSSSSLGNE